MKLVVQINVAFGILLVLILAITAVMFHFVLLDHLIQTQKRDMEQIGTQITTQLRAQPLEESEEVRALELQFAPAISVSAVSAIPGVEAVITDNKSNVLFSTTPAATVAPLLAAVEGGAEPGMAIAVRQLEPGNDGSFLVATNVIREGMLTLYTPMSKIKEIERTLLNRLLLVLFFGAVLTFGLSLIITRRLVRPLMKLRGELRKVEQRRFSEVRLVPASGEIGGVAHAVYEMAGQLETYNRIQKQFIQNASHELKTPLMSIAGYAEGIRDGVFEGDGVRKGLEVIMKESGRLKKIVTEMTLLAKLDGEEDIFRLAPVGIAEIVAETVERMNPLLVKNGISVKTIYAEEGQRDWLIRADRDKLLQALINIVSNAARYARSEITIQIAVNRDNRLEVAVTDDGDGIAEQLLPHLFHRFVKGKDGETGLGLAISRAIVERCGGQISARNRPAGGAEVSMRFPVASVEGAAA